MDTKTMDMAMKTVDTVTMMDMVMKTVVMVMVKVDTDTETMDTAMETVDTIMMVDMAPLMVDMAMPKMDTEEVTDIQTIQAQLTVIKVIPRVTHQDPRTVQKATADTIMMVDMAPLMVDMAMAKMDMEEVTDIPTIQAQLTVIKVIPRVTHQDPRTVQKATADTNDYFNQTSDF